MLRILIAAALLAVSTAGAADFFPLSPGARWTYQADTGETFEIAVAMTPIWRQNGHTYHKVTGYASQPLYLRSGEDGAVYWFDEERDREEILTDFRPVPGAYYETRISAPCEQTGQALERPVNFESGGVYITGGRAIRYRNFTCADTGIEGELYLANIGLVRRVNQTIAGPRVFDLTAAKIGPLTFNISPGAQFRVSLPSPALIRGRPGPVEIEVTMQLATDRLDGVRLRFPSSQRYDIAVKDERGGTVYVWSADKMFLPVESEEQAGFQRYAETLTLDLPDGRYEIEAWLTADTARPRFAASAALSIVTSGPQTAAVRPVRTRVGR